MICFLSGWLLVGGAPGLQTLPVPGLTHHHHLVADARRHVASATAFLYADRSCARRPASVTVELKRSLMSWLHLRRGRPLPLFPSTMPSYKFLSRLSCLLTWPKYCIFRFTTELSSHFSSKFPICSRIDMFVRFSVQEILRIFLRHFI